MSSDSARIPAARDQAHRRVSDTTTPQEARAGEQEVRKRWQLCSAGRSNSRKRRVFDERRTGAASLAIPKPFTVGMMPRASLSTRRGKHRPGAAPSRASSVKLCAAAVSRGRGDESRLRAPSDRNGRAPCECHAALAVLRFDKGAIARFRRTICLAIATATGPPRAAAASSRQRLVFASARRSGTRLPAPLPAGLPSPKVDSRKRDTEGAP